MTVCKDGLNEMKKMIAANGISDYDVRRAKEVAAQGHKNEFLATIITLMPKNEQEVFAGFFSEGCAEYKKWMLNLWGEGIPTLEGCSGIDKKHKQPSLINKMGKAICNDKELRKDNAPVQARILGALDKFYSDQRFAYTGLILTQENQKKIASIIENISPEDKKKMQIDIETDIQRENLCKGSVVVGIYLRVPMKDKVRKLKVGKDAEVSSTRTRAEKDNNTQEEAEAFFGSLNTAFTRGKEKRFFNKKGVNAIKKDLEGQYIQIQAERLK